MRFKDIMNMAIFDVLVEGLGFLFAAGVILAIVFGGSLFGVSLADAMKDFATAFCG